MVSRRNALPPGANTCTLPNGAGIAKGKAHVAIDAASVRGDCIVCNGRRVADCRSRASIQSGERRSRRGWQCRVWRSGRTSEQNVWPRQGWGTIQLEQSSAIWSATGQIKSLQELSHRQPYFASRSSFSTAQLNNHHRSESARSERRRSSVLSHSCKWYSTDRRRALIGPESRRDRVRHVIDRATGQRGPDRFSKKPPAVAAAALPRNCRRDLKERLRKALARAGLQMMHMDRL
jgi:hypothetical protein